MEKNYLKTVLYFTVFLMAPWWVTAQSLVPHKDEASYLRVDDDNTLHFNTFEDNTPVQVIMVTPAGQQTVVFQGTKSPGDHQMRLPVMGSDGSSNLMLLRVTLGNSVETLKLLNANGTYLPTGSGEAEVAPALAVTEESDSIFTHFEDEIVSKTDPNARTSVSRDHFYVTNLTEVGSALNIGYRFEGISGYVMPGLGVGRIPLYRLFNSKILNHFYTTSLPEKNNTLKYGYKYEGVACYVYPTAGGGRVPLYRLFSKTHANHFYTTSVAEKNKAQQEGYTFEGIACYVYPTPVAGSTPLYRNLYISGIRLPAGNAPAHYPKFNHMYTSTTTELPHIKSLGYKYEGVAFKVLPVGGAGRIPLFRLYHKLHVDHFYVTTWAEVNAALSEGYTYEGVQAFIYEKAHSSRTAIYRLWHPMDRNHLYTASVDEKNSLVKKGWEYQGVIGYTPYNEGVPLYRLYLAKNYVTPPCYKKNKEIQDFLYSVILPAMQRNQLTVKKLDELASNLNKKYGCDYGINRSLLERGGGEAGVINVSATRLSAILSAHIPKVANPAQKQMLTQTASNLKIRGGIISVPYERAAPGVSGPVLIAGLQVSGYVSGSVGPVGVTVTSDGGASVSGKTGNTSVGVNRSGQLVIRQSIKVPVTGVVNVNVSGASYYDTNDTGIQRFIPDKWNVRVGPGIGIPGFGYHGGIGISYD